MPRDVPVDLQTLLDNPRCETHSTLDMIYSDALSTERHWATVPFSYSGTDYTAHLKKIGDIRQSLSRAADRVRVTIKNADNVVCADVASSLKYFNYAEAIVGRHYSADDTAVEHWSELFRGRVVQPEVTEREVLFDISDSLVAAGPIIGSRPLTIKCPFRFKDPRTCAYVGVETACNKMPNSKSGCYGRSNTGKFGGWFWPYPITPLAPSGSGGSSGGGGEGMGACFREGTLVTMADGSQKEIEKVQIGDRVLCFYYDPQTDRDTVTTSVVEDTFEHDVYENYRLTLENGIILPVTEEHPLYAGRGAFRIAGYTTLRQQYQCLEYGPRGSYKLKPRQVTSMMWDNLPYIYDASVKVYNLHIQKHHTYFANNVAVHNSKPPVF